MIDKRSISCNNSIMPNSSFIATSRMLIGLYMDIGTDLSRERIEILHQQIHKELRNGNKEKVMCDRSV